MPRANPWAEGRNPFGVEHCAAQGQMGSNSASQIEIRESPPLPSTLFTALISSCGTVLFITESPAGNIWPPATTIPTNHNNQNPFMMLLAITPMFAAAGYSLIYLLGGGGLFGAVVIFFVAKMLGR